MARYTVKITFQVEQECRPSKEWLANLRGLLMADLGETLNQLRQSGQNNLLIALGWEADYGVDRLKLVAAEPDLGDGEYKKADDTLKVGLDR